MLSETKLIVRICELARPHQNLLVDEKITQKQFNFAAKRNLDFYFASSAEGTNVVKIFNEAIRLGKICRDNPPASDNFIDEVLDLLGDS